MVRNKRMRALYIALSLSMLVSCSGSKPNTEGSEPAVNDTASQTSEPVVNDTANQNPGHSDGIEEAVSNKERWEQAAALIEERKYPQAISVLSKIEDNDRADDLLRQLRYIISGDYIENLSVGVAAIDNRGKIVIRMDDELYKEGGYADAGIQDWTDIKRISCDKCSYAPGLDARSSAGGFFSVLATEEIRQRNEQLGMIPGIDMDAGQRNEQRGTISGINIMETSDSTFAVTDQGGKLHLYNKYIHYLGSESALKEIESWSDIVDIVMGDLCLAVLHKDGTVSYVSASEPDMYIDMNEWTDIVDISGDAIGSIAALKADGTVLVSYWMASGPYTGEVYRSVSGWSDIIAISKYSNSILGLKRDGTVVAAGVVTEGKKGVEEWTDIVAISAGPNFHVGLKSDGTLVIAGESGENWSLPDVSDVRDLYVPKLEEAVSNKELWEEAAAFIEERKYPQAISVLSEIEEDDRADDLLRQLRSLISGDSIQNLGAGVAAIDNEGKVIIRMDDKPYKERGYADAGIEGWTDIKRISGTNYGGLDAMSNAGEFFSVTGDEDIRQRNKQLGRIPDIDIWETSNSTFAVTDQSGKLHFYSEYDGYLEKESVQKEIEGWSDIVDIVTGRNHLAVLHKDGTVSYVYSEKQETVNYVVYPIEPDVYEDMNEWTDIVDISGADVGNIAALKADGTVLISNRMEPESLDGDYQPVSGWSDIIAISKSYDRILGLKRDGTVVTAGVVNEGQKKVAEWTDIVAVSAGEYFHVGLKSDGTLVIAGESGWNLELPDVSDVKDLYVPKISYVQPGSGN